MSTLDTELRALDEALDTYMREVNATVGEVKPVPLKRTGHREYILNYRHVTDDLIRMFSVAVGDTNPLWRDPAYAAESPWNGIIAPPLYIYTATATTVFPEPPAVPGFDLFFGGNRVEIHKPLRHGDSITAEDVWNGVENKSRPGKPHRTLVFKGARRFFNQNGERVATLHSSIVGTAPVPGAETVGAAAAQRPLRPYSDEELAEIYTHYDDELAGTLRRGAQPRFWEDVHEGDDLGVVLKGPLDILDLATFVGVAGVGLANADKWEMIRTELNLSPRDPLTGAYHFQMDWHLSDTSAQSAGMPRAINFGAYMDMKATHLVSNWLGDHGWVREVETRLGAGMFIGEILRFTGQVVRTYEEDGKGLAELAIKGVERAGIELMSARVTVELPHRADPEEVVRAVLA